MSIISCHNLTFHYPASEKAVLRDVSAEIDAAEFVLVAGRSGAGKSTWLRCLNGLVPHFSGGKIQGKLTVAGLSVADAGPSQLSQLVGFVFQTPEAQAILDVVEAEIAFGMEQAAIAPAEMNRRMTTVLDQLDITHLRQRNINTLSGGERQRVAIATALVLQPQILVLDEPTSQLDSVSAETLLNLLIKLNKTENLTIILAEHRLERVLPFASRLLYFEDGTLQLNGPVREVVAQLPYPPPLIELAAKQNWHPIPLSIAEARQHVMAIEQGKIRPKALPIQDRNVVLQTKQLTASYGDCAVLQEVDFSLYAGEIVGLLGANGSGKTTLLKTLVGLNKPTSGAVEIFGTDTKTQSVAQIARRVAYLPQNPDDLLFAETVLDELLVTLKNHGLDSAELPRSPIQILDDLDLAPYADAYPRDLSVGQRQRVALAALLVTNPVVVLLDEPTRGLDAATKSSFMTLLKRLRADGVALLLVTHDLEMIAQLADRVAFVQKGQLLVSDTPSTSLRKPPFAPQIAQLYPDTDWLTVADVFSN